MLVARMFVCTTRVELFVTVKIDSTQTTHVPQRFSVGSEGLKQQRQEWCKANAQLFQTSSTERRVPIPSVLVRLFDILCKVSTVA